MDGDTVFDAEIDKALERLSADEAPFEVDVDVDVSGEIRADQIAEGELYGDGPFERGEVPFEPATDTFQRSDAAALGVEEVFDPPPQGHQGHEGGYGYQGQGAYPGYPGHGHDGSFAHRDPAYAHRDPSYVQRDPAYAQRDPSYVQRDPGYAPPMFNPSEVGDFIGERAASQAEPPRQRAQSVYPLLPLAPPLPPPHNAIPMMPSLAGFRAPTDHSAVYGPVAYSPVGTLTGSIPQLGPVPQMMTSQYPSYTGPIPYIVQPVITAPAGGGPRWAVVLMLALIGTTALGLGVGWLLFARQRAMDQDEQAAPRAAAPVESTAGVASAPSATVPNTPAAPAAEAGGAASARAPVVVDVAALDHPVLAPLTSPLRGELTFSAMRAARKVTKGERLFEVKRRQTENQAELAARIAELRRLAKEDPVYEAFLARAREDYKKGQRTEVAVIKATADAYAEPRASRGDRIEPGQPLAVLTDSQTWSARANLKSPGVSRDWRCGISSADDSYRAICKIEQVAVNQSGAQITATVDATQVPWLRSLEQRPRLILEPPAPK